jgi:predicted nuclease with TOPRIM domain
MYDDRCYWPDSDPKYLKLKEYFEKRENLMKDLINKRVTVAELLQRSSSLISELMEIGEAFDTLEELEARLRLAKERREVPSSFDISLHVKEEGEHAEIAARFGVSSKFIYVHTGKGTGTAAVYYDLPEIAKDWTHEQLDEFCRSTKEVSTPSEQDKMYEKLRRANSKP